MKTGLRLVLALAILASPASAAFAKKAPAPTAPGKYTEWNGEIDELEIVQSFKLADYDRVVVEPFDTSATPLPEANDNTYAPVKNVLARVTPPIVEGLAGELSQPVAIGETGQKAEPGALVIRGKVITMDPGSKAARYWAGFGAGAARTEIEGDVMDARTGEVLLHFRQERRSGWGMFGGDYEKLMDRSLNQLGGDLAGVLRHF
jgi:Domain of unknown function (DUF4410)